MLGDLINGDYGLETDEFVWSDELEMSANWYLQDITGCNVYQPTIINDKDPRYYINQIATYENHYRLVIYPEKNIWNDP